MLLTKLNPRTNTGGNPIFDMPKEERKRLSRMNMKVGISTGFANGSLVLVIGAVLSLTCLLSTWMLDLGVWLVPTLLISALVSLTLFTFYTRYIFNNAVLLRSLCLVNKQGTKAPLISWLLPIAVIVATFITEFFIRNEFSFSFFVGAPFAILSLLFYWRGIRPPLIVLTMALLVLPMLLQLINYQDLNYIARAIIEYSLAESVLMLMFGAYMFLQSSSLIKPAMIAKQLKGYFSSDKNLDHYIAATGSCAISDPDIIVNLLQLVHDDNPSISLMAQIAFSNAWGPKYQANNIKVMGIPIKMLESRVPEELLSQLTKEQEENQNRFFTRQRKIEQNVYKLQEKESDVALEALYKLAEGTDVAHPKAQLIALELLGNLQSNRAYATLMNGLLSPEKSVGKAAVTGFYGAKLEAHMFIEKFFNSKQSWLKKRAICAMAHLRLYLGENHPNDIHTSDALLEDSLTALLSDRSTQTAALTVALMPYSTRAELLRIAALVDSPRAIFRATAIYVLSISVSDTQIVNEIVKPQIVKAIHDKNSFVRLSALYAVDNLALSSMLNQVKLMMSDLSPRVRALSSQLVAKYSQNAAV